MTMLPTLTELQESLRRGETTSLSLTEAALARIDEPSGEGTRAFTKVYRDQALAAAHASDIMRKAGLARSPIEGLPISIKDLFDFAGEATLAGSTVLKDANPAADNAAVVQRLLNAGAVVVGKTNMTEFAFSGLGLNPHYGTPSSPWDRATGRIPGGSSSGAGVSVADGMSVAAIGTDTGGSVRIPSAFCGLAGFKPTARRVPTRGALPLAFSLDSIGPLAASVACCATLDAILSAKDCKDGSLPEPAGLRFAVPASVVLDGADEHVLDAFERALTEIRRVGGQVDIIDVPEFGQLANINRLGGFVCAEAWAWHKNLLGEGATQYDPRVASRIARGKDMTAADYIELMQIRPEWIAAVEARLRHYDALLMPTVPVIAPSIKELQDSDEAYFKANALILRNPTLINFLDGCALSIPCHPKNAAPVGLMIAGPAMRDRHILRVGMVLESLLLPSLA
jgi:aspartyl-tRNA(Asn)/glutamyl-tRNA(Gln) amidotransferase subunit A